MKIVCPYCKSNKVEYVDILDKDLESYCCEECDEYFYVETHKGKVQDVRKTKWIKGR